MNAKLFVIFSIVFLSLDILWLNYFKTKFVPMIENVQKEPVHMNWKGAVLAYLVMLVSYAYLVYDGDKPNYLKAIVLGLAIYGTYEFTNYATLKNWNTEVLMMDIAWGMAVGVLSIFITNLIYNM
jgi:uncharacterized membrane protein